MQWTKGLRRQRIVKRLGCASGIAATTPRTGLPVIAAKLIATYGAELEPFPFY